MKKISACLCAALAFASSFAPNLARAQSWGASSYSVVSGVFAPAVTTPSDVVCISGAAAHTIRVLRVLISGVATATTTIPVSLVFRTTLDTGGTSTTKTAVGFKSGYPASAAVTTVWTVNPATLGTGASDFYEQYMTFNAPAISNPQFVFDLTNAGTLPAVVLGAATEALCINLNATTMGAGGSLTATFQFQDTTP